MLPVAINAFTTLVTSEPQQVADLDVADMLGVRRGASAAVHIGALRLADDDAPHVASLVPAGHSGLGVGRECGGEGEEREGEEGKELHFGAG